jgi:nucleoside-diphosphate-sugar epimerase
MSDPRRAIVTGATGFVGRRLAERLVADGWEVVAVVRDVTAALPCEARPWPTGGDESIELFAQVRPEVCFHLATRFQSAHQPADVVALVDGNVTLAALVGEGASSIADCEVVYTSSYWQHYEGSGYSPTTLYAAMKQAGEDVLRYYSDCEALSVTNVTLFNTYGPGEPPNRITSALVRSAIDQTPVDLSPGEQLVDLLHVDDVVDALTVIGAGRRDDDRRWRGVSVGSGAPITLRDLADAVGAVVGRRPPVRFGGRPYRPREMFSPWATDPPLGGWQPRITLAEGLRTLEHDLRRTLDQES